MSASRTTYITYIGMAYSSNDPAATDAASWLTKLEESCSSLSSAECQSDDIPLSKHQTDTEDRFTEHWLEAIDDDDPFGVGIQSDIPLQIRILVEAGRYLI